MSIYNPVQTAESGFAATHRRVMNWLLAQFAIMAVAMMVVGPLIPPATVKIVALITVGVLIASSFIKMTPTLAKGFAIGIPAVIGVLMYSTVSAFISAGAGNLVVMAAGGTAVIFGVMSVLGYTSEKSLEHWSSKLAAIVLGAIVLSLANVFFLHLPILSLIISIAMLIVFSLYVFIDIQRIRDTPNADQMTAAMLALNIFMDIINLFQSLLNILSYLNE